MKTKERVFTAVAILSLFTVICLQATFYNNTVTASTTGMTYLHDLCTEFTDDIFLHGEAKIDANSILNYESYLNSKFDIGNRHNADANISDEQIKKIVPAELFDAKPTEFLHIGKAYGFYFNYDADNNTFLLYLLRHCYDNSISGHFTRRLTPIYYETYTYDESSGRIALEYMIHDVYDEHGNITDTLRYYRKYSDHKKLFIKDVAFGGTLYNEYHFNESEAEYDPNSDRGGYFFGNYYKFKGVSTQSGKLDFAVDLLKTALGQVAVRSLDFGLAMDIASIVKGTVNFIENSKNDFRRTLTNETNYGFEVDEVDAAAQIAKYGHLLKDSVAYLQTPDDKDAVLYGIDSSSYVQNTFYINYTDQTNKWDTLFAGNVSLSIVEEKEDAFGSTLITLAENVASNAYLHEFDNGETATVSEDAATDLYVLGNARQKLRFVAPLNGNYTFTTSGTTAFDIFASKGEVTDVDDHNKQLIVYLKADENFVFYVGKENLQSSRTGNITVAFTPTGIAIGGIKTLEVAARETEYLEFQVQDAAPYDIFASGSGNFRVDIYEENRTTSVGESIQNASASNYALANLKYYIAVYNGDSVPQTIEIELKNIRVVGFGHDEQETVIRQQYFGLMSDISCGATIGIEGNDLFRVELRDAENKILDWAEGSGSNKISRDLEKNTLYYILIIRKGNTDPAVRLSVSRDVYELKMGANELSKSSNDYLYSFITPDIDTDYTIALSANGFELYDTSMTKLSSLSGTYALSGNTRYYLQVGGAVNSFTVTINVIYTEHLSGLFPQSGVILIKYVPTRSAVYNVTGVDNYRWYNDLFTAKNAYLYSGREYYLKVTGVSGAQYNVQVSENTDELLLNSMVSVPDGYYYFNITEERNYLIKFYTANGVNATVSIYDADEQLLHGNITKAGFETVFTPGLYYLRMNIDTATTVSIVIVPR